MQPADTLTSDTTSYCFALKDEVYAIFLKAGQETTSLNTGNAGKTYSVGWYNPREGGDLVSGSIESIQGIGWTHLGHPPSDKNKDWVILVQAE
jgi:hypothetical protein